MVGVWVGSSGVDGRDEDGSSRMSRFIGVGWWSGGKMEYSSGPRGGKRRDQ